MKHRDYSNIKTRKLEVKDELGMPVKKNAVAKGVIKKQSVFSKASRLFFGESGARGVFKGLVDTVIVPTVQNTIADVSTAAINRAIYGENIPAKRLRRGSSIRYDEVYERKKRRTYNSDFNDTRPSWSIKEIEFETEEDAREVFNQLLDSIDQYDYVTVGDYYEYSQVDSRFTDHQYGWSNLSKANLVITRANTYVLELPKPHLLD